MAGGKVELLGMNKVKMGERGYLIRKELSI
jgi:hypothetical protein